MKLKMKQNQVVADLGLTTETWFVELSLEQTSGTELAEQLTVLMLWMNEPIEPMSQQPVSLEACSVLRQPLSHNASLTESENSP